MTERIAPQVHFVLSAPRSGSTWLARSLNQHPQILACENRLFGMFCELWQNRNGRTQPRITADKYFHGFAQHSFWQELGFDSAPEMADAMLREWIGMLTEFLTRRSGKSIIVDKITPYLGTTPRVVDAIRKYFPEARLVHLIRDGRDVVTSGVFDWLGRQSPESLSEEARFRDDFFLRPAAGTRLERFLDDDAIRTWTRYWTESIRAFDARTTEPTANAGPAPLVLRYEQMLTDPVHSLQRLFDHFAAENTNELARHSAEATSFEQLTGRRPGIVVPLAKTRSGTAGDWKNYFTRHDARLFQELAGAALLATSYEKDHTWVDACPQRLALHN
jgi:hypothetical protein